MSAHLQVEFIGNNGRLGGAVFASGASVTFNGTTQFTNNNASLDGGAVAALNSPVTFDGPTQFTSNSAVQFGGGVFASGAVAFNGPTQFINNFAGLDGGGSFSRASTVTFDRPAQFSSNSAVRSGGGLFEDGGTVNTGQLIVFTGNTAGQNGGALVAFEATLNVNGALCAQDNVAIVQGGGFARLQGRTAINVTDPEIVTLSNNSRGGGSDLLVLPSSGSPSITCAGTGTGIAFALGGYNITGNLCECAAQFGADFTNRTCNTCGDDPACPARCPVSRLIVMPHLACCQQLRLAAVFCC